MWDSLSKKHGVFQSVQMKPLITPLGSKTCHIDLDVRNLATVWLTEWRQPIAYQSGRLLADWWYWTNRIARNQQRLISVNDKRKSKQLSRPYRMRSGRFQHAVAAFARQLLEDLYRQGVSTIVIGELTGIRENTQHGRQGNAMLHNYERIGSGGQPRSTASRFARSPKRTRAKRVHAVVQDIPSVSSKNSDAYSAAYRCIGMRMAS